MGHHDFLERVIATMSYIFGGLLTVVGLNAQEWYWIVGAVCTVVTTIALWRFKQLNYELRLREVRLAERLAQAELASRNFDAE
ncbi:MULTISPECIES: HP1 family phage holin [unclassified Oceanobacter]|uniref:HP1 family phage holin n=1 Tax=unclassified Oceanobacter TaxID=2620260 RepID=UPI002733D230|nr:MULTISPECIES: HP1 family phage holin [unclassified Oceanobacter]MDP2610037.1 HP1 family phage holin [Oceanobacter sp. 1_MG-2023]MDP2613327.1 HP1 family phage holin [Oceanobacter sp. 2_MG-2023]